MPHTPDWYDAQYDNRARIPAFAERLREWQTRSAQARAAAPGLVEYAYGDDPSERLDVFPAAAPNAPVLVMIHGGYWRALGRNDYSFVAPAFTAAGAIVVVPDYSLCPAVTIEQIVMQMVRALAWVHRNAAAIGADARRIVVAGHSAGGHLAAILLACDWRAAAPDLPADLVRGAISISGLHDLEPIRRTPFLAEALRLTRASARRLSPAKMAAPPGPLVTIVGADESEEFLRQSVLIGAAWPQAVIGADVVPGRDHLSVVDALADRASRTHARALQLLGL